MEQFVLGLEQGCDTIVPSCEIKKVFKPFVEDELSGIIKNTTAILAHPGSEEPCPHKINSPVTLAIGPEGGFIQYEVDMLINCGFKAVNIGLRPLRVEDAVSVTLGKLF
jgi:RsmE family RNA methyltransferase